VVVVPPQADVGAEVLERTAAFHGYQEPPDAVVNEAELR
jgi:hypothetical protein